MKTIFITVFEGVESKNILHTDVLKTLLATPDVRAVLFVKNKERQAYHEREFRDPRIEYAVVEPTRARGVDHFFSRLKFLLLDTKTVMMRRQMLLARTKTLRAWVGYGMGLLLRKILARQFFVRLTRMLDEALVRDETYASFFERYHPDLVLCANLFDEPEVNLIREAKKRGVKTIGLINSWDKATARSVLRLVPDRTIVFNEIIKKDMMVYHAIREQDIFVGGLPQYDEYFTGTRMKREEFFREIGCDPAKRLIVYSPLGTAFTNTDWERIDLLSNMHRAGRLGADTEFFVRFPPYDTIDLGELERRPHSKYDYPGARFSRVRLTEWDMTTREVSHLADTLFHMSLLICHASSISVDAAVFDRPVINISFEVSDREIMPDLQQRLYRMTHYVEALKSGGIRLVDSREELAAWVQKYLDDSTLDQEGRVRLAREQCPFRDGKSGERIGRFIIDYLMSP